MRIKRFICVLLAITLILGVMPLSIVANATDTVIWNATEVEATADSSVYVNISLTNAQNVYGGNFTLQYDNEVLEAQEFSYSSLLANYTKNCNLNYQNVGNLIRFTFSGSEALGADGTVVTLKFNVKGTAKGTSALQFNAYKAYGINGTSLGVSANAGSVKIIEKQYLELDIEEHISVSESGKFEKYYFIPQKTGYYCLDYYNNDYWPIAHVYNEKGECIDNNFDNGSFEQVVKLQADTEYLIEFGLHSAYNTDEFDVKIVFPGIKSIHFEDCYGIENIDCYEQYDGLDWNEYRINPEFTVEFEDGTTINQYGSGFVYKDIFYPITYSLEQSYYNQLSVGDYPITGTVAGCAELSDEFTYSLKENPVSKIEFSDVHIVEGTHLDHFVQEWEEGILVHEYNKYSYEPEIKISFKDGTTQTTSYSIELFGNYYSPSYSDDQSYDNRWGVGTHTVNASFLGFDSTFNVIIDPSPIAGIEIKDSGCIVGTNGYYTNEYNPETGNWDLQYFNYDLYHVPVTVLLKNGEKISSFVNSGFELDGEYYYFNVTDNQDYYNQWNVGHHNVTVDLAGISTTFDYEIYETPIESIRISTATMYKGIYNDIDPDFEITLKDGTTLKSIKNSNYYFGNKYIEYDGKEYSLSIQHTIDAAEDDIGMYSATAQILGKTASFNVELKENPIRDVVFESIDVIEGIDGYKYYSYEDDTPSEIYTFYYEYIPKYTVYLKDGNTVKSDENGDVLLFDSLIYPEWYDYQYDEPWDIGAHTVEASFAGFEKSFTVNVLKCPYKQIEIKGTNELSLVFTKENGETVEEKIIGFDDLCGDEGMIGGTLYTENNQYDVRIHYYVSESGYPVYENNVTMTIGNFTSNALDNCYWLKAQCLKWSYGSAPAIYRSYCKQKDGRIFKGYNSKSYSLDDVITIAANIYGTWNAEKYETINGYTYAFMDINDISNAVKYVFGISEINYENYSLYDSQTPYTIKVLCTDGGFGNVDYDLTFLNGNWDIYFEDLESQNEYDSVHVLVDEKFTIQTIEFINDQEGCSHKEVLNVPAEKSTCTSHGHAVYSICKECGKVVSGSDELLPLADHKLTHHSAKSPTESSDGNVEYWKCDTCGKCFSDSEAKSEIEESGTVVSKDLPRLEIEGATTRAGKTVEIYVSINNNPGIISLRNKIVYDTEALELESVEDTGLLKSFTTPAPTITSPYTLRWADSLALANNNANGKIIKLVFKVKYETAVGKYEISVNFVESYTFLGEKVQFLSATSFVEVVDYIVGDADGDGEVSDWDAILLQRYLAGWNVDIELVALDFDGDGEVSDWDAILFERYLAGWSIETYC